MSKPLSRLAPFLLAVYALPLGACQGEAEAPAPLAAEPTEQAAGVPVGTRNAYFGDLHIPPTRTTRTATLKANHSCTPVATRSACAVLP